MKTLWLGIVLAVMNSGGICDAADGRQHTLAEWSQFIQADAKLSHLRQMLGNPSLFEGGICIFPKAVNDGSPNGGPLIVAVARVSETDVVVAMGESRDRLTPFPWSTLARASADAPPTVGTKSLTSEIALLYQQIQARKDELAAEDERIRQSGHLPPSRRNDALLGELNAKLNRLKREREVAPPAQ